MNDPGFTGLHRLEYGLWHGQGTAALEPVVTTLATGVATVRKNLASGDLAGDPANLPLRAHEILEDALRDHLSRLDDQGAGAAYPQTHADLQVTRVVLSELAPLIDARAPQLLPRSRRSWTPCSRPCWPPRRAGGGGRSTRSPLPTRQRWTPPSGPC